MTPLSHVKSLSNPTIIQNNREFHEMLLFGVNVQYRHEAVSAEQFDIKVIFPFL